MSRQTALVEYMRDLLGRYEALQAERARLLQAQTRLVEIQTEKSELLSDAQDAVAKYNQLAGTSYTLLELRNRLLGI